MRAHADREEGRKRRELQATISQKEYGEVFDFSVFREQPTVTYKELTC